ncbi:RebB family R body protein [Thalassomonas actiniarum]|uniref:RebB family R body protein n=1 Tax=Thalassomonas actiniarum TaxID=485447 RepID=A0AAF0C6C5_9GAMM|nr:RebB family R body protein [Thalassomonas actiniarum]WDE02101.1 RebB family R body protein [Thalassomonas actiniarum]
MSSFKINSISPLGPDDSQYSVDMIDTMFADSLSRGMQNAIVSQQNAQMASSASITNACARILQALTAPAITEKRK